MIEGINDEVGSFIIQCGVAVLEYSHPYNVALVDAYSNMYPYILQHMSSSILTICQLGMYSKQAHDLGDKYVIMIHLF